MALVTGIKLHIQITHVFFKLDVFLNSFGKQKRLIH